MNLLEPIAFTDTGRSSRFFSFYLYKRQLSFCDPDILTQPHNVQFSYIDERL